MFYYARTDNNFAVLMGQQLHKIMFVMCSYDLLTVQLRSENIFEKKRCGQREVSRSRQLSVELLNMSLKKKIRTEDTYLI